MKWLAMLAASVKAVDIRRRAGAELLCSKDMQKRYKEIATTGERVWVRVSSIRIFT